jgi:hypothetical protein
MHTNIARLGAGETPILRSVRRLGVLALLAGMALAPASAWGQLYGRPVAQPCFDFPNWARFSNCRPGPLPWGYDVFPDYGSADCACDMPGSVACPGDWVAHRPSDWYATADFAPLTLDYQDDVEIARIGPDGPTVLDSGNLQPEFEAGGKFTIGRRIFDCYRLEGTYLGRYEWQDSAIVTNTELQDPLVPASVGNLSTFLSGFSDPLTPGLDGNSSVTISMRSSLESGEVNLRYWADMPPGPFDVSYLVGARYMRIRDQFNFFGEAEFPAAATNDLQFDTDNELWGVQIGIAGAFLKSARWWVDVDLKGGIYNNHIIANSSLIQDGVETALGVEIDRTTWVGDFSVVGNWQMTPSLTFRIGYQAMFIGGLALAQEQNVGPLFTNTPGPIDDGGELAYHGPTIGLTWMR